MGVESMKDAAELATDGLERDKIVGLVAELLGKVSLKTREVGVLQGQVNRCNERIEGFLAGAVVPEKSLIAWRERCFEICEGIDRLRDEMRVVLLEIGSFPPAKGWDKKVSNILSGKGRK